MAGLLRGRNLVPDPDQDPLDLGAEGRLILFESQQVVDPLLTIWAVMVGWQPNASMLTRARGYSGQVATADVITWSSALST